MLRAPFFHAVALAAVALVTACATPRSRADDAFAQRRYREAADRYDALAGESTDPALVARRDAARREALIGMAAEVRAARDAGHHNQALRLLVELLEHRDGWQLAGGEPVAAEVAWASRHVTGEIDGFVRARRPAAARAVVASRRAQLSFPDFEPLWTSLTATLASAGAEVCRRLDARTPYLAALAADHCARAGVELAPGILPHAVAGVALDGAIEGMTDAQRDSLAAAIDRWLSDSPWYARGADARATVAVHGRQTIDARSARTTVDQPWYERVPYTTTAPATAWTSDGKSVTVMVPKTEYRQEERWFHYQALRHDSDYRGDWRLTITIGPRSRPLVVRVADAIHRTGLDHDVSHEPSGLSPSRADLPTADDWSQHLQSKLEPIWRAQLAAHWAASFCEEVDYTPDTAARCALGATPPPAAREALATVLGPDVDLVLAARAR